MSEEVKSLFDQVKGLVDLEKYFAGHLNCDLRMEGTNMMATICPWHQEKTPSLKIHLDEGYFRCFGACDYGGSVIDAVMKQENMEYPIEAVEWLNQHYKLGLASTNTHHKEFKQRIEKAKLKFSQGQTEMNDSSSRVAAKARDFLIERGIEESTWQVFGLSVDKEEARLLIPIFERGGHPVAWSERALMDKMPCPNCKHMVEAQDLYNQRAEIHSTGKHEGGPRWCSHKDCLQAARNCPHCTQPALPSMLANQFPKYKDSSGYQKKETLYNLPQARKTLRGQKELHEQQPILVMEGFGDVWAAWQVGFPGSLAYNGGSMTLNQAGQVAELAKKLNRFVGLVPDTDPTGRSKIYSNIQAMRKADPDVDVRVLHSIDSFYRDDGSPCKDLGEVVQHHGNAVGHELLAQRWWGADEFRIREIVAGQWDKLQEIERITQVLSEARHTIALDELVPMLATHWSSDEATVRTFLHHSHSRGAQLMDSTRLIATIVDAHRAAEKYLEEGFVIPTDYESINECLPGGGFRLGQLSMVLGKCLQAETPIRLADSSEESIAHLYDRWLKGEEIVVESVEEGSLQVFSRKIQEVISSGYKPIYRIVTEGGASVECSREHLLLTDDGWQRLEDFVQLPSLIGASLHRCASNAVLVSPSPGESPVEEQIITVSFEGRKECYDLVIDAPDSQRSVIAGGIVCHNSGTGKTTLIANMLWQFLRSQQLPCIFFSLEQSKAQVYITLTQIALGVTTREAEEMIRSKADRLEEVDELFQLLTIIDNVPEEGQQPQAMTPQLIAQLIHETNLNRGGEQSKVVAVDHLGMVKPGKAAPQNVRDSDAAAAGFAMEEFYSICKQTQTFFMVLQQLPKEVPPGEEFGYDAGRGASQQTDFCDYIVCIWRPDQLKGLSEDEKTAYEGQYKFKLGKNRHGANNITAHLTFDHQKRRITTESAFGIPTAFMPPSGAVDLGDLETGAPPGLFTDSDQAPPPWFLS